MRTTINLPDGLAEAAKNAARARGTTFTSLVVEGLRRVIDGAPAQPEHVDLPTYGAPDGRARIDLSDREAVAAALDADGVR